MNPDGVNRPAFHTEIAGFQIDVLMLHELLQENSEIFHQRNFRLQGRVLIHSRFDNAVLFHLLTNERRHAEKHFIVLRRMTPEQSHHIICVKCLRIRDRICLHTFECFQLHLVHGFLIFGLHRRLIALIPLHLFGVHKADGLALFIETCNAAGEFHLVLFYLRPDHLIIHLSFGAILAEFSGIDLIAFSL